MIACVFMRKDGSRGSEKNYPAIFSRYLFFTLTSLLLSEYTRETFKGLHRNTCKQHTDTYLLFKQSSVLTVVGNVSLKPYKDVFITFFF